jgi:hypothetical protein
MEWKVATKLGAAQTGVTSSSASAKSSAFIAQKITRHMPPHGWLKYSSFA